MLARAPALLRAGPAALSLSRPGGRPAAPFALAAAQWTATRCASGGVVRRRTSPWCGRHALAAAADAPRAAPAPALARAPAVARRASRQPRRPGVGPRRQRLVSVAALPTDEHTAGQGAAAPSGSGAAQPARRADTAGADAPDARVDAGSRAADGGADDADRAHFGFREVPAADKSDMVRGVFASVAPSYDVMNDLMSGGLHRVWKDHFVRRRLSPLPGMRCLDVAGGTGDIAERIVARAPTAAVTVCDVNEAMLREGRARQNRRTRASLAPAPASAPSGASIQFVQGDAEALPFDDDSFDAYTISFGMRNVTRPERALAEANRVLRPGGRFLMLEFGRVDDARVRRLYDAYSFGVIPRLGGAVANDRDSYEYLVQSIRRFADQRTFCRLIRDAGAFDCVSYENLTFGIAAIYSGFKLGARSA